MIEIAQQRAINVFRKHIECFPSDKKLTDVLSFMEEHEFIQVVVRTKYGSGDVRLLTTVGILAWLTNELGEDGCGPDSTIDDALHYEPEETTRIMGPNHTPEDVRNSFKEATTTRLFAVILTNDGRPTGHPVGIATPWDFELSHSDDFRCVTLHNTRSFTLTPAAALAVQVLYDAYQKGTPELSEEDIMKKIGSPGKRLRDSFRNLEAWNTLVIQGKRRGTYRLDL
jgi:hypothetical protein